MKRTKSIFAAALVFAVLAPLFAQRSARQNGLLRISFDYRRSSTIASNQIAVWVENESGEVVKTIFVTDFTARRRGYQRRENSLKHWVQAANPAGMTNAEIDAVSGATPSAGNVAYTWDLRDDDGNPVPDGTYTVYVEGTLYWDDYVLAKAEFNTAAPFGPLAVNTSVSQTGATNSGMITNVAMSYGD